MRLIIAAASASVCGLLFASPGAAQLQPRIPTGSHIPVDPETLREKRAGPLRKAFARCIYNHDPKLAVRFLENSDPISVDYAAAGVPSEAFNDRFGMEKCLSREAVTGDLGLRMRLPIMRAMLVEEAYLAVNKAAPVRLAADAPAPVRRYATTGERLARVQALGELSDCIVRTDPGGADGLLRSMPGSDREALVARALGPVIGGCLYQGQTVNLAVRSIRAFVADGAWQVYGREARDAAAIRASNPPASR